MCESCTRAALTATTSSNLWSNKCVKLYECLYEHVLFQTDNRHKKNSSLKKKNCKKNQIFYIIIYD